MEPVRTCIGCRSRAPRSTLLRVVVSEAGLQLDESATLPGRGAWLHPTLACVEKAEKRRAFHRALRTSASIDITPLKNRLNGSWTTNERLEMSTVRQ